MFYLRHVLASVPAREVLVLIDASMVGTSSTYPRLVADSTARGRMDKPPALSMVQHVLTAGRRAEPRLRVAGTEYTPFVLSLLSGLGGGRADADGDRFVSSFELAAYVRQVVPVLSEGRNHPQFRAFTPAPGGVYVQVPAQPGQAVETAAAASAEAAPVPLETAFAALEVTSQPDSATVLLDGQVLGTTPLRVEELVPGDATVEVRYPQYFTLEERLYLRPDTVMQLNAGLVLSWGVLRPDRLPAGAQLVVDGEPVERTSDERYLLPVGLHRIEVRFGDGTAEGQYFFRPGEERVLTVRHGVFTIQPLLRNIVFPGQGQYAQGARWKGVLLFSGTAAAWVSLAGIQGAYLVAERRYTSRRDAYAVAVTEAEAVERRRDMMTQYDRVLAWNGRRNIAIGLVAGFYAASMLDVLFFHSRISVLRPVEVSETLSFQPSLRPVPGGLAAGLHVRF